MLKTLRNIDLGEELFVTYDFYIFAAETSLPRSHMSAQLI